MPDMHQPFLNRKSVKSPKLALPLQLTENPAQEGISPWQLPKSLFWWQDSANFSNFFNFRV